jgi:hypothetical protein
MEIHETPFYIAEWDSPDGQTLARDQQFASLPDRTSPDIARALAFFELVVEATVHGRPYRGLLQERLIVGLRSRVRQWGYERLPAISDFERLSANMREGYPLSFVDVEEWIKAKGLAMPARIPDRIRKRPSIIYAPQSQPRGLSFAQLRAVLRERIHKKGGDPYTGQPLAFDYLFCRLGPTPYERDTNLIIDLSYLGFSDFTGYAREAWKKSPLRAKSFSQVRHIPSYTMQLKEGFAATIKNFVRLYAFAADIIVFRDGMLYF